MSAADMAVYMREYRARNPDTQRKWSADAHERRRAIIRELKLGKSCMDRGALYPPYVMQYDHRPGEEKLFSVSNAGNRGRGLIEAEVAKCDLVCANCHAERTYRRIHCGVG